MKTISLICAIVFLAVIVSSPINSAMDKDGKLEAHATAKKAKRGDRVSCLAKSKSDDIKIVNGWWGLTIQIDDTTWDRPTDDETPQYSGKTYKRLFKRERTEDDSAYSWAYISGVWTNGKGFYAGAYDGDITE